MCIYTEIYFRDNDQDTLNGSSCSLLEGGGWWWSTSASSDCGLNNPNGPAPIYWSGFDRFVIDRQMCREENLQTNSLKY